MQRIKSKLLIFTVLSQGVAFAESPSTMQIHCIEDRRADASAGTVTVSDEQVSISGRLADLGEVKELVLRRDQSVKSPRLPFGKYDSDLDPELRFVIYAQWMIGVQSKEWDPLESTCRHASLSIL